MDSLGNTRVAAAGGRAAAPTQFQQLPDELVVAIFSLLTPAELGVVRSVCRRWNRAVLDKTPWLAAFRTRFGTGAVFASVSRSEHWLPEYYARARALRTWKKARAQSVSYPLANSDSARVDLVDADFAADRLLSFCALAGSVSVCTLTSGRAQVHIPPTSHWADLCAFDCGANHLCVANARGDLYVKNLLTATSSGASSWSLKKLHHSPTPIVAVRIARVADKHRARADVLSATATGSVAFWTLAGALVTAVDVAEPVRFLDSDFKSLVVVVGESNVHVLSFASKRSVLSFPHGWSLAERPPACHVDFHDANVVIAHGDKIRVFHIADSSYSVSESHIPDFVSILDGTIQPCRHARNPDVVGGDGLLYALTFSDGSVGVYNIRGLGPEFTMSTRILPFEDDRAPAGIAELTKVALNSAVIAIGALADWIHIYDAHSGEYLREATKVASRHTRHGSMPISSIQFAPTGASGVVVSGDVVQYFTYGQESAQKKPLSKETHLGSSKRDTERKIKVQLEDYDAQEHQKARQEMLLDKYNGTSFDSEQEELRIAMALSASCSHDDDLQHALAQSQAELEDPDLSRVIAESEATFDGPEEGPSRMQSQSQSRSRSQSSHNSQTASLNQNSNEESDEEILRRVLELSMIEH